jgi:hypothetical protein
LVAAIGARVWTAASVGSNRGGLGCTRCGLLGDRVRTRLLVTGEPRGLAVELVYAAACS